MKIKIIAVPYAETGYVREAYDLSKAYLIREVDEILDDYKHKREEALLKAGKSLGSVSNLIIIADDVIGIEYYHYHTTWGEIYKFKTLTSLRQYLKERFSGMKVIGKLNWDNIG